MSDDHKRFSLFDDSQPGNGGMPSGSASSGGEPPTSNLPPATPATPEPAPAASAEPAPAAADGPSAAGPLPSAAPPWPAVPTPPPADTPPQDVSPVPPEATSDRARPGRRAAGSSGGPRSIGRAPKPAPWPESWEEPIPPAPPTVPSSGYAPRSIYTPTGDTDETISNSDPPPSRGPAATGDTRYRPAASPAQRRLDAAAADAAESGRGARRGAVDYPPPPPPVRPPPSYEPFSTGTPVSRGVAFKRPQDIERRNMAVPIVGIVLVLLGLGIGIWLLGIVGGPDRGPTRTPSPKPTIGGVAVSPSSSASDGPTSSFDTSQPEPTPTDGSPTDFPTDQPTDTPTDGPTATPTRTPRKTTPPPTATPTANPTPTPPPGLPSPQPTQAPPGFPTSPGDSVFKVDLGDGNFSGGKSGTYNGRSARRVYGSGTGLEAMSGRLTVTGNPHGTARLRIVGLDSGDSSKTHIRIRINGTTIFDGSDPLANGAWSAATFDFSSAALRSGTNRITITNLESGSTQGPPFLALDSARLLYATP